MMQSLRSKSSEELILLYQEINKELRSFLLDGSSWEEQQNRTTLVTEIAKELAERKIDIRGNLANDKGAKN